MKKNSYNTTYCIRLFYGVAAAQVKKRKEATLNFGITAGLNTAYVTTGNSGENTDATTGFNAGVSGDFYFSNRWSLKVKVLYDQKRLGQRFYN